MANGGKDIRLGDDKRPVNIIPQNTDNLFNIANGELLTDEFGTPLITEVDQFLFQIHWQEDPPLLYFPVNHKIRIPELITLELQQNLMLYMVQT